MTFFKLLPKTNIDFVGLRKIFFPITAIVMIVCIGSIFIKGLNYGIDFTGGTMMQVQFEEPIDIAEVRNALAAQDLKADIQSFVGKDAFTIRIKGAQENVNEVSAKIETALKATNTPFNIDQTDFVGPTVGNHLAKKALFAFVLAMGAMIIYIGFRFQNIIWGAMAVVALFHDVLFTAGIFSLLQLEIDLVIVAAFLTIAGFSVNDTIVIFDRVRENIQLNPKWDLKKTLNVSVNETLSRTIITTLTVLAASIILFTMGGEVLHNFAFAMVIGLVAGTYSTIALVIGLVYQWTKNGNYSASVQGDTLAAEPAADEVKTPKKKKSKKRNI